MSLTVGSLFAGIGGFDLGFARHGLRTAWAVEKDADACRVLAARFPEATLHDDVCTVGRHNLLAVDVLCGGFPCQDLSVAGKREGLGGARSGLFHEMVRIADELRPRYLVWENVPGLLSGKYTEDEPYFSCICGWSGGRRRLYYHRGEQRTIFLPQSLSRDDGEGGSTPQGSAGEIRGLSEADKGGDGSMVCRLDAHADGDAGDSTPARNGSTPDPQVRTMPDLPGVGRTSRKQTGKRAGRNLGRKDNKNGEDPPAKDSCSQSQGTGAYRGGLTDETCPSCGRRLDGGATRPVERSWMGDVLGALASIGYYGAWRILDAQFFGVAQRRRRVFGVFARGHSAAGCAAQVLALGEGGDRHPAQGRQTRAGVTPSVTPGARRASGNRGCEQIAFQNDSKVTSSADTAAVGVGGSGHAYIATPSAAETFQANGAASERSGAPSLAASDDNGSNQLVAYQCHGSNVGPMGTVRSGNGGLTGGVPFLAHTLRAEGCDASEDGTGRGTPLVPLFIDAYACRGSSSPNQHPVSASGRSDALDTTGPGAVAFQANFSNQGLGGDKPTLTANSPTADGGGAGMAVRRLTPVECCRLQGFPDDWLDLTPPLSDSAKYRLLGNAVCVVVSQWIGRRLHRVLSEETTP